MKAVMVKGFRRFTRINKAVSEGAKVLREHRFSKPFHQSRF